MEYYELGDYEEADSVKILLKIIERSSNTDTKLKGLDVFLGLSARSDGLECILRNAVVIFNILIDLTFNTNVEIAQKACLILINISAEERGAQILISTKLSKQNIHNICKYSDEKSIVSLLLEHALNRNTLVTAQACIILSNMSRDVEVAREIHNCFHNTAEVLNTLVSRALHINENSEYVTSFLSNLSQLPEVRKVFLDSFNDILEKILALVDVKNSLIRRKGAVGILRNLSFSVDDHKRLLNSEVDLLSRLLLPLAGPEEFDDEENEKLPLELQYLPDDKTREEDPEIRKMLLETLMQLCTTKYGRDILREKNVYVILREYHKWESDYECVRIVENLVNFLLRTEQEIGVDSFENVEIPSDLIKKFSNFL